MTTSENAGSRPLRADAAKNRQKILEAAGRVFAERGLDATLDDIAEAADVGVATVYRRFPDKESLVTALFEHAIDDISELALRASEIEDSWRGFVWFMEEVLQRQCDNRGLRDVIIGSPYTHDRIASAKLRISPAIAKLIGRAQRDGHLRSDVGETDILVLEMMISSLGGPANQPESNLWRRHLAIVLDGLIVSRSAPCTLPVGPADDVVMAALRASKGLRR